MEGGDSVLNAPTYGELIDLYQEVEVESFDDETLLCEKFKKLHPSIPIGRPRRFFETVKRISAPVRPSLRGTAVLTGSPLSTYRRRAWRPRLRRNVIDCEFPKELSSYGLSEELLATTFHQVREGKTSLDWCLKCIPTVPFYQALHRYLKSWPVTTKVSKVAIGRFYAAIDSNLKAKESRPDNVYRFVENLTKSTSVQLVNYGSKQMLTCTERHEMKALKSDVEHCNQRVEQMSTEYEQLKDQFQQSKRKLQLTEQDISNQRDSLKKSRDVAMKKVTKFKAFKAKHALLENECAQLHLDNIDLSLMVSELESEAHVPDPENSDDGIVGTCSKIGHRYPPEIRKLYYSLLAEQIPASKVEHIVKVVLQSFHPSTDVEKLLLPKKSCASYMRREELKTVSNAHKATVLCESATQQAGFHVNTDGTTKNQRKIGGVVINDIVVGVNELSDGTAMSAVTDISNELKKLRQTAHALGLQNPDSINWTLFVSSTSDSASTQKRVNKLIEDCREHDEKRFGAATQETLELVENFCSMHLGVNLRKAFLSGIDERVDDATCRKYHRVDVLVHEFCKLLGKHGVPEYASGALSFPDFLELMSSDSAVCKCNRDNVYFRACCKVTLQRQVGSRYFVSAANASKIVLLKDAAIEFLEFTGKNAGNKLEKEVYVKLQDPLELLLLRSDALMYYHVYADLVMLSKSKDLGKSTLDMNQHYLELKTFLREVEGDPNILLDKDRHVFVSEKRLYGNDKKTNHRLHPNSLAVYENLFGVIESEQASLCPLLIAGATAMEAKLCSYARNQLPEGKYWNPDKPIRDVLAKLKPSNDICESVLGLNDYLTTAIPNLHQVARSNLIQMKKNKTLKWLNSLPEKQQMSVLDLAVKERQMVSKELKREEKERTTQRQQAMLQANIRREALKQKQQSEKEKLTQQHLISSSQELYEALEEINNECISASKKKSKKLFLVKTQVHIRKIVLKQKIRIVFSRSKRQRPLSEVVEELADFISANSPFSDIVQNPEALVGLRINHRFEVNRSSDETKWYSGVIVNYNKNEKTHEIVYDGEEEHCCFDLSIDLVNGDLKVVGASEPLHDEEPPSLA